MKKIKVFSSFGFDCDLHHEKQIELYIDFIPKNSVPKNTIRFVFLLEAIDYLNLNKQAIDGFNNGYYNFLLTHNEDLLVKVSGSSLFEFGSCWIKDYEFPEKEFAVSTLVGGKGVTPGHKLRQKLWFRQNKITNIKTNFFLSGNYSGNIENYNNNPILGSSKNDLFNSKFHICIEQSNANNYFSEKLIDCLQTKTIPIFWGCDNIGNFFDTNGFFIVKDIKDIIDVCNSLDENSYKEKLTSIENNFEQSKKYIDFADRIKMSMQEILDNLK